MAGAMMISREVRRVPMDFDFPVHKTWTGYLMPEEYRPPECVCGGLGYSPWAEQMNVTWYANSLGGEANKEYRWRDKLTQFDVDVLIKAGRFNPVIDCPHGCKRPEERGWVRGSGESWRTNCSECQGRGWTREQLEPGAFRFLVLVTTNEDDMGQINDAVGRHGRAAFNTEFKALTRENAREVFNLLRDARDEEPLDEKDFAALTEAAGKMPLADVFALLNGAVREAPQAKVGFA